MKVEKTIDIFGQFVKKNGKEGLKATLTSVYVTPGSNFNVCSLTRLLMQGWSIAEGNADRIILESITGDSITFDIIVKTAKGVIAASTESGVRMNINQAHSLLVLGHGDETSTRITAKERIGRSL